METIISETNLKVIKEITNEELKKDSIDDNSRFLPKGKAVVTLCILTFGATLLQFNSNKKESAVYLNGKNSIQTEVMNIETIDNSGYNIDSEVSKAFKNDDGVAKMSKVTREELNEKEKYFDEKIVGLKNDIEDTKNDIKEIRTNVSKIATNVINLKNEMDNLPDKLKAQKWDFLLEKVITVILTGVVVGIVLHFLN
ncbi:MAG: hypothetical protein ABF536_06145 [Liquorilactobacillus mali]|uniref:hypothetical protein n=1 Tax=Liquorilactobacillus mali TaxID=1618 RepID=UPI0039E79782